MKWMWILSGTDFDRFGIQMDYDCFVVVICYVGPVGLMKEVPLSQICCIDSDFGADCFVYSFSVLDNYNYM